MTERSIALVIGGVDLDDRLVSATIESAVTGVDRAPNELHFLGQPTTLIGGLGAEHQLSAGESWLSLQSEFVVFVAAGGLLAPEALRTLSEVVDGQADRDDIDVIYVDDAGYRAAAGSVETDLLVEAAHRPGFSPDRLRAQMYLGELVMVRRSLAERVDPDGSKLNSPMAHHVALALCHEARAVAHIPQILYKPRVAESESESVTVDWMSDVDELNIVLERQGFPGRALPRSRGSAVTATDGSPVPLAAGRSGVDLVPNLQHQPLVSIIIPTMGAHQPGPERPDSDPQPLVVQAVESVLQTSTYPNYELIIVVTPGAPEDLQDRLAATLHRRFPVRSSTRAPAMRFCRDGRPFNFSNASNRGAVEAVGEVLVFLNDDTKVLTPEWLERLVMYAMEPDVGAVGARLLYGDGRIQHAGIWTRGGHPSHRYGKFAADHPGYMASLAVPQNCLAVTGACLAVETSKFSSVGGFSPIFASSYNDVDLCLKLADFGFRTVVDPTTTLVHFESATRDPRIDDRELEMLHERWRNVINRDPFDNPNHLAPLSDEFPPPDSSFSERRREAGKANFDARVWPLRPLVGAPQTMTARV